MCVCVCVCVSFYFNRDPVSLSNWNFITTDINKSFTYLSIILRDFT